VNTEITDVKDGGKRGWVFFDADCALCIRWAERLRHRLERAGFELAPLQSSIARAKLGPGNSTDDLLAEMRVATPDGVVRGGADAVLYLAENIGGGIAIRFLRNVPGTRPTLRALYRHIARTRTCRAGTCRARPANSPAGLRLRDWLPLAVVVPSAIILGRTLAGWVYMWTLVFALYGGCKWLSLARARAKGKKTGAARTIAYLFAWPGMDAATFLQERAARATPPLKAWLFAFGNVTIGVLLWGFVRGALPFQPLFAAWIAMVGFILVVHFGLLSLVALAWRATGVDALPLMRAPIRSHSLGEFWGRRWNTGFHQLADEFVFRPLRPIVGLRVATLLVFLVSGLVHDLVISLPARGGYGLPTAYFVLQGAGVLFEHSNLGFRLEVGRGWRGWLFTMIVTAGPVFWLFHPAFVLNVMVPFFQTLRII
jgi:predicted DCC family thiol-disulfide oxidoreductase YuxK